MGLSLPEHFHTGQDGLKDLRMEELEFSHGHG